jgi:hypothetical protein
MNATDGAAGAPGGPARLPVLVSVGGGLAAAGVAWAAMRLVRAAFQVRTLPERLLEWALLFVPLDLFEAGLRRFGFQAKQYALAATAAAVLALLVALGALALRRRWSGRALAALGLGVWLVTMAGVMPLTGAGFFAADLIRGTGAAVAGYLAVALAYAAALAAARALAAAAAGPRPRRPAGGGAAAVLTLLAAAAFAGTPLVARWSPRPALPAATVAAPPAAGGAEPARPPGAAREASWDTTDPDAATNGNVGRAADLVAGAGVPAAGPAAGPARVPWAGVGEVREYTGTVERLREYAPGGPAPPWPTDRRPLGEVLLVGAAEAGRLPVVCLTLGGTGGLREGDRASVRGYLVGVAGVAAAADRGGGSTTGLVLVGEVTPRG